ncbi:MAG: hypothetical protein ACR2QH_11930 [Geminicoccaceae bacterium]
MLPEEAMPFVPVVAVADNDSSSPVSSAPAKKPIEIHLGTTVIKVPDDVPPKQLTKVLRAVKAAL